MESVDQDSGGKGVRLGGKEEGGSGILVRQGREERPCKWWVRPGYRARSALLEPNKITMS